MPRSTASLLVSKATKRTYVAVLYITSRVLGLVQWIDHSRLATASVLKPAMTGKYKAMRNRCKNIRAHGPNKAGNTVYRATCQ
jgi:hypothetical protein